jgi:hypothetical protein
MPYHDAEDCRIRVRTDGTFDVACAKDVWVGAGRYDFDGKSLVLNYVLLTKSGRPIEHAAAVSFQVSGEGNKMTLTSSDGQIVHWTRSYGND